MRTVAASFARRADFYFAAGNAITIGIGHAKVKIVLTLRTPSGGRTRAGKFARDDFHISNGATRFARSQLFGRRACRYAKEDQNENNEVPAAKHESAHAKSTHYVLLKLLNGALLIRNHRPDHVADRNDADYFLFR